MSQIVLSQGILMHGATRTTGLVVGALILAAATMVRAQGQAGAAIVRIPDVPDSRCISAASDRLWITLRRAIVDKKGDWLKEDVSVAFLVTAQMRLSNARPVSFPLMADATVERYPTGQVSIPVEFTFIDGFALTQDDTTYSGANIEVTILNQRAKTSWGSALTALSEMAKKLPLPTGPVTDAVTYLMDFGMSALNKDTAKVDPKDKAKSATIAMNFHPTGDCAAGGFERTGTVAVLQDPPSPAPADSVPIKDIGSYCWSAQLTPVFVLYAARKDTAMCTDLAHYKPGMRPVTNSYVGLVLSAVNSLATLGASEERNKDLAAARKRCEVNGLDPVQCGVGR